MPNQSEMPEYFFKNEIFHIMDYPQDKHIMIGTKHSSSEYYTMAAIDREELLAFLLRNRNVQ